MTDDHRSTRQTYGRGDQSRGVVDADGDENTSSAIADMARVFLVNSDHSHSRRKPQLRRRHWIFMVGLLWCLVWTHQWDVHALDLAPLGEGTSLQKRSIRYGTRFTCTFTHTYVMLLLCSYDDLCYIICSVLHDRSSIRAARQIKPLWLWQS